MMATRTERPGSTCVRVLNANDHDALVSLALTSSTGSERFRVDRSRDFFALGRALGDTQYHGLFDAGRLIGSLAVSEQLRFVTGEPRRVAYLHDVRLHPAHAGRGAFGDFVGQLVRTHAQRYRWLFCSVLDDNPHAAAVRKLGGRFGAERVLGRCVHVGLPVVRSRSRRDLRVTQIPPEHAWAHYVRLAGHLDMAPADRERFATGPAEYLSVSNRGEIVAVAKWLDQSGERRIVAECDRSLPEVLLSAWFVARGGRPLARRGHPLPLAYLSHFATATSDPAIAHALAAFIAECSPRRHSHVFLGVAPELAGAYRGLGVVRLSSTSFAYGAVPDGLTLAFRELSWI